MATMRKKSKRVKIYDPARDAYYDIDIEKARKYATTLKELEKAIRKAEAEG